MKINFLTPLIFAFVFSCNFSGKATQFQIPVSDFDAIKLNVPGHVLWSDDDKAACELDCSQETKDNIEVVQEGTALIIRWKEKNFSWGDKSGRLLIRLQSSSLTNVSINGSGEFVMKNVNDSDKFQFNINGSGDLKAMVSAKDCEGSINGSGDAEIAGKADIFHCNINGSGDVKAFGLQANSVKVQISGSGDAEVTAHENLEVKIAGSGDVRYKGDPKKVSNKVAGSGSIQKV